MRDLRVTSTTGHGFTNHALCRTASKACAPSQKYTADLHMVQGVRGVFSQGLPSCQYFTFNNFRYGATCRLIHCKGGLVAFSAETTVLQSQFWRFPECVFCRVVIPGRAMCRFCRGCGNDSVINVRLSNAPNMGYHVVWRVCIPKARE